MGKKIFRYANNEERKIIWGGFPEIEKIKISYDRKKDRSFTSMNKFIARNDLEQWIGRFSNKLGDIRFTYLQLMFSYNNGIPDSNWKRERAEGGTIFFEGFNGNAFTIKFLFDFYTEVFYYHYFSSFDLLHKTLNILMETKVDEYKIGFNEKVQKKIKQTDSLLYQTIKEFLDSTSKNRNVRNSFTHDFAPNEIDLRSKQKIKDGKRSIVLMDPSYMTSSEIVLEIQNLIKLYLPLINQVQKRIDINDIILTQKSK